MSNTSMNIRMDKEVKQQAQEIFAELGMDMTTAINIFLRQSIRSHGLPFPVRLDTPNSETLAALQEARRMKADPSLGKTYTDADAMMKELLD